ncbi:amidase [Cryobacterium roopkundense]|uniref:Amidase n=1 Tax=Cryobacterium roopkundense TaxID=1001240 RepID=A0A7W8ZU44_9MICO|nr:amidase [Cryobacterium roopkundense]MBB5640095.1 amidase [Cryobacterium roopkundense]
MAEPHELSALEQWQALQTGELSPSELAEHYLDRIEALNPALGAFVTITAERAWARARDVEQNVPRTAPLWGLPFADKDLQLRAGVPARFGSRLMRDFVPEQSDDLVLALDEAGGVSLGKTSTPEFGLPSYTEGLAGPPARNPWNVALGAGGSSGGAAVAVAARLLPFAPGSDGGGSVRIPAAACGLVGVKPSRGRVPSASGIDKLGGLPVAGPLARTVADAALLLDAMVTPGGNHPDHHFALRAPHDDGPLLGHAVRGEGRFQLGVMTSSAWDEDYDVVLAPEALAALDAARTQLDVLGHGLDDLALEPDPSYVPAFRTIWQAGAASIPAEGDEQEALLDPLTRWLMRRGRALSARALAEALAALSAFERSFIRQLSHVDAVLTPALALTPRPVGWYDQVDPERNFAQQVQYTPFTSMVNVSGLPAIVLPVLQTADGLPMGVQLIGRPGGEATLLAIGAQLERHFRWQERVPPEPWRGL